MDELEKHLRRELEEVDGKVDTIREDIRTIITLLTGTKYDESQGLINRFEKETMDNETRFDKMEKRLDTIEKLRDRILYIGIGLGMSIGTSVAGFLYNIYGKK